MGSKLMNGTFGIRNGDGDVFVRAAPLGLVDLVWISDPGLRDVRFAHVRYTLG